MTRLDGYWSKFPEYWHIKNGVVVIHDDAPKVMSAISNRRKPLASAEHCDLIK